MNYTKGDWRADGSEVWCGELIVAHCPYQTPIEYRDREANARLIAAAPKLYEACLVALGSLAALNNGQGWVKSAMDTIQEALAEVKE